MQDHEFALLLKTYTKNAVRDIGIRERVAHRAKRRKAIAERVQSFLKRLFLGLALTGVVAGFYFAHDLGWLTATLATPASADPSLVVPTKNIAKVKRKLAEVRLQKEAELEEVMQ